MKKWPNTALFQSMKNNGFTGGQYQIILGDLHVQNIEPEGAMDAPTLVFLHDALGSIAQWGGFPLKLALRTGLKAVVYDRLGHGKSSPLDHARNQEYLHREALEILPELLKELRIQQPILIGHSDGGSIALIYAAYHRPTAVITEAAHVFVEDITLEGIRSAYTRRKSLLQQLRKYHGDKTDSLFQAWYKTWLNPKFRNWNLEGLLSRIQCPTMAIQGRQDQYGTEEQIERIIKGIGPEASPLWIEQCGHIPHREAEEAVLSSTAMFIEKHIKG